MACTQLHSPSIFFFQAEDGIRDLTVTGVQTCALPIMTAAVATGRITPQRLDQSVRRVLEIKRRLGLFQARTVSLDSIMLVVGARRFQDQANDLAVRALTLVRDMGGRLHALRAHRSRLALIAYADENNGGVGQTMAQLLRQGGDTVE